MFVYAHTINCRRNRLCTSAAFETRGCFMFSFYAHRSAFKQPCTHAEHTCAYRLTHSDTIYFDDRTCKHGLRTPGLRTRAFRRDIFANKKKKKNRTPLVKNIFRGKSRFPGHYIGSGYSPFVVFRKTDGVGISRQNSTKYHELKYEEQRLYYGRITQ